jgi:hypothetical protein
MIYKFPNLYTHSLLVFMSPHLCLYKYITNHLLHYHTRSITFLAVRNITVGYRCCSVESYGEDLRKEIDRVVVAVGVIEEHLPKADAKSIPTGALSWRVVCRPSLSPSQSL